jgi:K+/H+ antiporter YhaU regulatory subunit KhtT
MPNFIICNACEFKSKKKKIQVIAQNSEKFIMFDFDNEFKDSFSTFVQINSNQINIPMVKAKWELK